ncbi:MAG: 2-C-methyl-D-erythritol 4-phosphate cytidylyltransferase [Candidatus Aminicenantes bacterium]|nr:2-C-methyl-D-erythritol 4-phosphate cytidylyltransferase [Candidatus Aminicenantes bacterium]
MNDVFAVIAAAGEGERFGEQKQFVRLRGKEILEHCLEVFEEHTEIDGIVLVLKDVTKEDFYKSRFKKIFAVVQGGNKRQESVFSGLKVISTREENLVLVHDGVRPLVTNDLISRVLHAARKHGAAIPVLPVVETVKRVQREIVVETLDRRLLMRVQTPQGFHLKILKEAFDRARAEHFYGTDEASLVEKSGFKVFTVPGDPQNIKITTPLDVKFVEAFFVG